ncbi:MAG TPA: hypothetical protein VIK66_09145 [Gaiellaceae bacterium]
MRAFALGLCLAAIAAPAASAKGRLSVTLGNATPRANQAFVVYVRTGYIVPSNDWLRLIAVAPGKGWYDVVGTVTGDSSRAHARIPHDGFEVKLVRTGTYTWRAVVRLPRVGRWRLVVPNGTHAGFMVPPPSAWMPWVRVHA